MFNEKTTSHGYEIFVKNCETLDWDLMDEVMHEDYMYIDQLTVLNKEEMKQRSIDHKTRGFELLDGKEIFDTIIYLRHYE